MVKVWQPAQHLCLLLSLKSSLESELIKITLNSDTILRITVDPSPCLACAVSCASWWCFPPRLGSSVCWVMVTKCFRKLQFGNGDYKWDCRGWWRGPSQEDLVVLLEQRRGDRVGMVRRGWRQRAAEWHKKANRGERSGKQHGEGCCKEQWVSWGTEVNFKWARAEEKQFLCVSKATAKGAKPEGIDVAAFS